MQYVCLLSISAKYGFYIQLEAVANSSVSLEAIPSQLFAKHLDVVIRGLSIESVFGLQGLNVCPSHYCSWALKKEQQNIKLLSGERHWAFIM